MQLRALITGVGGFVGQHLARHLLAEGLDVHGLVRAEAHEPTLNTLAQEVSRHPGDLLHAGDIDRVVQAVRPDLIFHLAAQASVPESWRDPATTYTTNVLGQLGLIEAVQRLDDPKPRLLVVSSNEVYGAPTGPGELPVRETNPLRPNNPYAVSKAAQDLMAYQYVQSHRLPIVRVRPFNHIGPGQSDAYVAGAFARQVAEVEAGVREPVMRVGNLTAQRDFTDVRDIVRGYLLAVLHGVPGEVYNLASGRAIPVQRILDFYVSRSRVPLRVERDPARFRPVDVASVYGDSTKLSSLCGWAPAISLETTLSDVLEYWRARVHSETKRF
ncbi:MAG: GDP-mannose 4,6-dehydratase [Chloroflexota bacterium]